MSRIAEVLVLAADAHDVMDPLTRENDGTRPWNNVFVPVESQWAGSFGLGWAAEFTHRHHWAALLEHLQSLAWPRPNSVQVLIHDEGDDCFGLWMLVAGEFVEVPLPGAWREPDREPLTGRDSTPVSNLYRSDDGR